MLKNLLSHKAGVILQSAISQELYASNLYKHLSNQCQRLGYLGAANYFRKESKDELEHYQLIADYMNDLGSVAEIPDIDGCDDEIKTLYDAVERAYKTEVDLGKKYTTWHGQVDPMTGQFLLQFLETQRKSIGEYGDLLSRLQIADDNAAALLMIDQELGK